MCGIWALIRTKESKTSAANFKRDFDLISHRGPDSHVFRDIDRLVSFGFHRLAIIDPSEASNQPLSLDDSYLICNGEIYNYQKLGSRYSLKTKSDCEVILHQYLQHEIENTVKNLDGEFAFVLYDQSRGLVHIARDPFGVRPLFWGSDSNGDVYVASEAKGIGFLDHVEQFLPGHYTTIHLDRQETQPHLVRYFELPKPGTLRLPLDEIYSGINKRLTNAVQKRLMSDRLVGVLLSGGVDSSLVADRVIQLVPEARDQFHFFTIGMRNSVDVAAAKKVAMSLKIKNHHIIEFDVEDGFSVLEAVVWHGESYDVTTIRASTPMYLMAKYIRERTNVKVILSGEGADELFAGYQYFKKATDGLVLAEESKRLLTDLAYFDNLRADRMMASFELEVRVPFLDLDLVSFVTAINPSYRLCNDQMEKTLLRNAMARDTLLPREILFRSKEAFSDAVSSREKSWYRSLVETFIEKNVSEHDLEVAQTRYKHNPPQTREALYYRKIFDKIFPMRDNLIPYYWMPKWVDLKQWDPSATVLDCHQGDLKMEKVAPESKPQYAHESA